MQLRNFTSSLKEIAYRLLILLIGAQIILGALWFFGNLTGVQAFPESAELLEISDTWVLDDYVGIAYPAVLWLLRKLCGQWHIIPLYLLQFLAVLGAGCFFLDKAGIVKRNESGKVSRKLFVGGAYLATVPMILQFLAAQLPYAFGLSAFLVVLGECLFLCRSTLTSLRPGPKSVWTILAGWCLGALFMPDYIWLMALPVLAAFVIYMWRKKKCYPLLIVLFVGTFLVNVLVAQFYQEPGAGGRMEKSLSGALLRRCVWPNFERDYFFWSHNVKILFPAEDMISVSCEPENVVYDFGFRMEETYGTEVAKEEYLLMVRSEWEIRTKELLTEILQDGAGYLCPQIATALQLDGKAVNYSGWSYHFMSENTPRLTTVYWNVSNVCFWAALVICVGVGLVCLQQKWKRILQGEVVLLSLTVLWMALWYTMSSSGMWDYRNVLPVAALWTAVVIYGWGKLGCKESKDA